MTPWGLPRLHHRHLFTGRITGTLIATSDWKETEVFLTEDERVLLYENDSQTSWVSDDPVEELRNLLDRDAYIEAMNALGEKPVVDL